MEVGTVYDMMTETSLYSFELIGVILNFLNLLKANQDRKYPHLEYTSMKKSNGCIYAALLSLFLLPGISEAKATQETHQLMGISSYYGGFHHGHKTASGEVFNMHALTAAHRTLPLGSHIQVTNLSNGKRITLKVTDRGPYKTGRILDVSQGAAKALGMLKSGTARVRIQLLDRPKLST